MFRVDEVVNWSPEQQGGFRHPREQYGEGPFAVVDVREVPDAYACGTALNDQDHKDFGCPYHWSEGWSCGGKTRRDQVGHHQWLTVRPVDNAMPCRNASDGQPASFSGVWFVPASG